MAGATCAEGEIGRLQIEDAPWTHVATLLGVPTVADASGASAEVIELLTHAYEHFKQGRHSRMIFFLAAQMAQEYFHTHNFEMARRFFERICKSYQREKWWGALAHILRALRLCALELGQVTDFAVRSVALLSRKLSTPSEAAPIMRQLRALVALEPPADAPFPPLASPVTVDTAISSSLCVCYASWSPASVALGGAPRLQLRLASSLAVDLRVSSLVLSSSDAALSRQLTTTGFSAGDDGAPLHVSAGGELAISGCFTPAAEGTVTLHQLQLVLGTPPCAIVLKVQLAAEPADEGKGARVELGDAPQLKVSAPLPALTLQLDHASPLLVGERAPCTITLHTNVDACHDGSLELAIRPPAADSLARSDQDAADTTDEQQRSGDVRADGSAPALLTYPDGRPIDAPLRLPALEPGASHTISLLVVVSEAARFAVSASASYAAALGSLPQAVTASFDIVAVRALELSSTLLLTPQQVEQEHLTIGQPFRLLACAKCVAPPPISLRLHALGVRPGELGEASQGEANALAVVDDPSAHICADEVLNIDDERSSLFTLRPMCDGSRLNLGTVYAQWSRAPPSDAASGGASADGSGSVDSPLVCEWREPAPAVDVRCEDFELEVELPSEGALGQMLPLRLRVKNQTRTLHALRLSFAENEAFLFCGFKLYHFQLPPGYVHTVTFNLIPIQAGAMPLPPLRLFCASTNAELLSTKVTHTVLVLPAGITPPCPSTRQLA